MLPAEFLDEQLCEISLLQEGAGALEVEGHELIFADAERANDFGFAGLDVIFWDAEPVFLVQREDKGDEFFVADARRGVRG